MPSPSIQAFSSEKRILPPMTNAWQGCPRQVHTMSVTTSEHANPSSMAVPASRCNSLKYHRTEGRLTRSAWKASAMDCILTLSPSPSTKGMKMDQSLKVGLETLFGADAIKINIVEMDKDSYYASTYMAETGAQSNFDIGNYTVTPTVNRGHGRLMPISL